MKESKHLPYFLFGIGFVVFAVISFVLPFYKGILFFTSFIYSTLAFFISCLTFLKAIGSSVTTKKTFLHFPLPFIAIIYLATTLVSALVFFIFPSIPYWIATIILTLELGAMLAIIIAFNIPTNEISRIDQNIEAKTKFIELTCIELEIIAELAKDAEIKSAILRLAEMVKFSDPMSSVALEGLEGKISDYILELKNSDNPYPIIKKIELSILERNKKCRLLKEE